MGRELPKNVKQIGNVCSEPKIYVEDYVDTYLSQLCERMEEGDETPVFAALTGERLEQQELSAVFITGALPMRDIVVTGNEIVAPDAAWERLCDEKELFLEGQELIGWCLIENGRSPALQKTIRRFHDRMFAREHTIFAWKDVRNGEEQFYARKYDELMEIGGHYIFYERNPAMQNFLITSRKKIGMKPGEVVEDRAAKNFRLAIQDKAAAGQRRKNSRFAYGLCAALVLIVLGMGIVAVNSYDRMSAVQSTLNSLTQSVGQAKASEEETETDAADAEESEQGTAAETVLEETGQEAGNETDESGADTTADTEETAGADDSTTPDAADEAAANLVSGQDSSADSPSSDVQTDQTSYAVKKGDTLDSISLHFYGTTAKVDEICELNQLEDGNLIIVGQNLLLP